MMRLRSLFYCRRPTLPMNIITKGVRNNRVTFLFGVGWKTWFIGFQRYEKDETA
jgi:hypothetical protein